MQKCKLLFALLALMAAGTASLRAFTVTTYTGTNWGRADLTTGMVIENFEDRTLASGLEIEISDSTDNYGPTNQLAMTFDPFADDPNASRVFSPGLWDGSRVLINRRTPPPVGYADFAWGDTTFHITGGATAFGFSLENMELSADLRINGVLVTNLNTLFGGSSSGRNGYVFIQATGNEQIVSVTIANSANASTGDGLAFDHVAFTPSACLNGMVSWWKGEGDVNDALHLNEGASSGGVTFSAGKVGQGLVFNGSSHVRVANDPSLEVANITVEGWFKGGAQASEAYLVSKSLYSSSASYALKVDVNGLYFYVETFNGTYYAPVSSVPVLDNNFHHVAGTYDGSTVRLYVDGTEVGPGWSASGPIYYEPDSFENGDLFIGALGSTASAWNGTLDEFSIYDRALSSGEITAIYTAGSAGKCSGPPPPGPIAYTWKTGAVGPWNTSTNWTPDGVPGANDSATISSGSASVDSDVTVGNVTLSGSGTITGVKRLTVKTNMTWTGGTLSGTGEIAIPVAAKLEMRTVTLNGRTLNIMGTATWTNSTGFTFNSGRIDVAPGGVFNIRVGSGISMADANGIVTPSVFNNYGSVQKSGTGTPTISISAFNNVSLPAVVDLQAGSLNMSTPFNNDGMAQVQSAAQTLVLNNGGLSRGEFQSLGNGKVVFNNGIHTLTNGARITGTGTNRIVSATLDIAAAVSASYLEMTGGQISGTGSLLITNGFFWSGGTLAGSGSTIVPMGSVLRMTGSVTPKALNGRTLSLDGNGTWSGIENFSFNSGVFAVFPSGVFDIQTDAAVTDSDGLGTQSVINNFGTIRKSAGTGRTGIGVYNFANSGTLAIEKGIVSVTNNFSFGPTNTAHFILSGTNSGTDYGVLELGSQADLDGTLQISFNNGFSLTTNDTNLLFTLVTFPSRTNFFAAQTAPLSSFTVMYYSDKLQFHAGATAGPTPFLNITQHPQDVTAPQGGIASFAVGASGSGSLSFQWRKDGNNVIDGANISGAQSASLTVSNVTQNDQGAYDVVVANNSFTNISNPASLIVTNLPEIITLVSDSNTLAAATTSGLTTGDTTGLTFVPAAVGAFGTGTPLPSGSPEGTQIINISSAGGQSGFFKVLFNLPANFRNASLSGRANMDDSGYAFLNGNVISSGITQFGDAFISTTNPAFFRAGQNEILVSDNNSGGGPSGGAFYFIITYESDGTTNPPPCTFTPAGLVSWWRGEGDASDALGAHSGTLAGGLTFTSGKIGQAFTFDGSDDSVDLGNWFNLQTFSLSLWVKAHSNQVQFADIIDNNHTGFRSWVIQYDNTGLQFHWGAVGVGSIAFALTPDTWQHLVVTVDTNQASKLYLDGQLIGSTSGGGGPIIYDGSQHLRLGTWGAGGRNFKGQIDEVDIYNRALTAGEVMALYAADTGGKCFPNVYPCAPAPAGLVGWWKFDGDVNEYGGIIPLATNNIGFLTGEVNTGIKLSSGGYLDFPNSPQLENQNFTWEAWVRPDGAGPTEDTVGSIILQKAVNGTFNYNLAWRASDSRFVVEVGGNLFFSTNAFPAGQFYHVAMTYDGANVRMYVNGALEIASPLAVTINYSPVRGWSIGANWSDYRSQGFPRTFNGVIDELSIYNRALSQAELQSIYEAASSGKCPPIVPCVPAPSGTISWWQGEGNANDALHLNEGALQNGAGFAAGKVGQAFKLDGVDDYVSVPDSSSLESMGQMTLECWFKFNAFPSRDQIIVSKGQAVGFGSNSYLLWLQNVSGVLHLTGAVETDSGLVTVTSPDAFSDTNEFHHIALVYDGGSVALYVDGAAKGSGALSGTIRNLSDSFLIGRRSGSGSDGNGDAMAGLVDEVTIYNRALVQSEIHAIHTAGSSGKCLLDDTCEPPPGIIGWWPGNGDGSDAVGSNPAYLTNGASFGPGKVGQAFTFDGSNDAVLVPTLNATTNASQPFTLEAWVKFDGTSYSRASYNTIMEFGNDRPWFGVNNAGKLELFPNLEGGSMPIGVWTHTAYTWDGTMGAIYIDGIQVATNLTAPPVGGGGLGIGFHQGDTSWLGSIDEPGVYDRALTAAEIQGIYVAGSLGKCEVGNLPSLNVSITHPVTGNSYPAPASFVVRASASDRDGVVTQVKFLDENERVLAIDTNAPYELPVSNLPAGNYTFLARAMNDSGDTADSDPVTVEVTSDCAPVPNGILAWWRFEDLNTGVTPDESSQFAGTLQGDTSFTSGQVDQAFSFDGSGDYITVPDSPAWAFGTNDFTIELWANFTASGGRQTLIGSDDGSGTQNKWVFWLDNGALIFHLNGSSGYHDIGSVPFSPVPGQWYHLAVSRSGNSYTIFINGIPATVTNNAIIPDASAPLTIGVAEGNFYFKGTLDEIAIYSRAVSASEIQAIYAAGANGKCASLVNTVGVNFLSLPGAQTSGGIVLMNGGAFIVGNDLKTGGAEGLIASLVPSGSNGTTLVWGTNWPGLAGADHFYGIAAANGNIYAAGDSYARTIDTQAGGKNAKGVLVKFPGSGPTGSDLSGSIWGRQVPANGAFNYGGAERMQAATALSDGTNVHIYATGAGQNGLQKEGFILSKINPDSTIVWTVTDAGNAAANISGAGRAITSYGGAIYVAGETEVDGEAKAMLRKYDLDGNLIWSKAEMAGRFNGIVVHGAAIYTVGQSSTNGSEADALVAKWDLTGQLLWSSTHDGDGGEDILNGVAGLGNRLYAVGSAAFGNNRAYVLVKIDPRDGEMLFVDSYDGPFDDLGTGIASDGNELFVVGQSRGETSVDDDIVVLRYQVSQFAEKVEILTSTLPYGEIGVPYTAAIEAVGGKPPYIWTLSSNTLPNGLSLSADGVISGQPAQTGVYNFSLEVADASTPAQRANRPFSIRIVASNTPPEITIVDPANGSVYPAPASFTLVAEVEDDGFADHVDFYKNGEFIGAGSVAQVSVTGSGKTPSSSGLNQSAYTFLVQNLPVGGYEFTAVAYDDLGASNISKSIFIRVNDTNTTVIDFEALNASDNDVFGPALSNYLSGFGITLTDETDGTLVGVRSDDNVNDGNSVKASSGDNFISQTGSGQVSYTIRFANPVATFGFTRIRLLAGLRGISHPQWRATAYNSNGDELGNVGEGQITSYANIASQFFKLYGPNIASVKIEADDFHFTEFHSPLLDDFTFTTFVANQPPVVNITSPAPDATFTAPANVTITASASDSDGSISEIRFYAGSYLVDSISTTNTASTTLEGLAPGTYIIRAVAVDNSGAVRSSDPLSFVVNQASGIAIINFDALNAAQQNVGGTNLAGYLAAHGVSVTGVTRGGRVEAADVNNLFSGRAVIASSPNNIFSLFGVHGPVTFTLNFVSPQNSVRFTRPALTANNGAATHPWWIARAFDANGDELASVGETLIQSASDVAAKDFNLSAAGIASVRFDSNDRGEASFSAVLIDDLILNANVVVNPLGIQITSPPNGSSFVGPTDITITANPTNRVGAVARVEFFAGPGFIASATSEPYSIVWEDVLPGTYKLRARVVDAEGAAKISAPVEITVTASGLGNTTIVNFEDPSLVTASGPVTGNVVSNYLRSFGLTITNVTAGTQTEVDSEENIYDGDGVEAASEPNIFTQTGNGATMGFTILSSNVLESFNFTRPKLIAGDNGITHPAWRAIAYNSFGVELARVQENFISSYFDVSSREFTLTGSGIAAIRFESDNQQYAAFDSVLLDDLILTKSTSNLPPVSQIINPSSGSLFLAPANVTLTARALDPDGSVTQVNFYYQKIRGTRTLIGSATPVAGEANLSWNNVAIGRYTIYAEAVDNNGATGLSDAVAMQVQPSPDVFGIVDQPNDLELAAGETAVFSVTTTDLGAPISFQWFVTDFATYTNSIPGATTATLEITNVSAANIASYFVIATSGTDIAVSEEAYLNVVAAPVILVQPQGQTVGGGENVTFTVSASGAAPLRYQWLLNGSLIQAATNTSLTLQNVQPADSGNYRVIVQNPIGVTSSDIANLRVSFGNGALSSADAFANRISISPLFAPAFGNNCDASTEPGEPLHAGKRGGKSIWFTWHASFAGVISFSTRGSTFDTLLSVYFDNGTGLSQLTNNIVATDDDSGGNLTSRVTFNCQEGSDYIIAVDGFNGACGYVILGLPAGGYRVVAPDSNEQLPRITSQPQSQSVAAGASATLSVTATSETALSYQWFNNNTPILTGTNSSFTIASVENSSVGRYFVQVVNDFGSVDSAFADIQIVSAESTNSGAIFGQDKFGDAQDSGVPASVIGSSKTPTSNAGTARTFNTTQIFNTVSNTKEEGEPAHCGESGGRSQWYSYQATTNGVLHINTDGSSFDTVLAVYTGSGLDLTALTVVACDRSNSGNGGDRVRLTATAGTVYYIAVDGVGGAGGTVQLNINLGDPPAITSQPQSVLTALGGNPAFNVGAIGSTNLTFQWQFNGANISGATDSSFTRSNAQSNHIGAYRVVLSNPVNVVTSSVATLSMALPPAITSHPTNQSVAAGGNVTFSVVATGAATLRYQWRFNGTNIANATNTALTLTNVQPSQAGLYSVRVTNAVGSLVSSNATLTVIGGCTFVLSTNTATFNANGGSASIAVTTDSTCEWTATNANAWITITSGGGATGSGTVDFTVAANPSASSRTGTFVVAGQTITVTQSGAASLTLINGNTITFDIAAGTGIFAPSGSFLFVTAPLTNTFRVIPLSGATATNSGEYAYAQVNAAEGTLTIGSIVTTLTFTTPTSGTYVSTNGTGSSQSGVFRILPTGPDFNGDGRLDLMFQRTNRQTAAWFMTGTNFVTSSLLRGGVAAGVGWQMVGQSDFDGDGRSDLLWHNTNNNKLAFWFMDGTTFGGSMLLRDGTPVGAGWNVVGVGDSNNDKRPDIFFQHTDRRLAVWYMNGTSFGGAALLRGGQAVAAGWKVVGVTDLDGDGFTDVIFQHDTSNKLVVWYMNGITFLRSAFLRDGQPVAAGWRVEAVADLNEDGRSDLVFQHSNGKLAVWFLNNNAFLGSVLLRNGQPVAGGWKLVGPQ